MIIRLDHGWAHYDIYSAGSFNLNNCRCTFSLKDGLMVYNPELVKQLLGDSVAELFDGTVTITPYTESKKVFKNLVVGDTLTFKFKDDGKFAPRQFVVK
jgi:hypothetical protein